MIDIEAIAARAEAATPGPWESGHYESVCTARGLKLLNTIRQSDAEFIAHAREDIPALLAHISELTARAEKAEAQLARAVEDICDRCEDDYINERGEMLCEQCKWRKYRGLGAE